jgi:hypothetical protein
LGFHILRGNDNGDGAANWVVKDVRWKGFMAWVSIYLGVEARQQEGGKVAAVGQLASSMVN